MRKILLITGASSDVGIELYKSVYAGYDAVFLQYRNKNNEFCEAVAKYSSRVATNAVYADFCDENSVKKMIESIVETGDIPNAVVHLPAPKAYNKQFHKDRWSNFEKGWEVSIRSIVNILQAFMPGMMRGNYGRIVFMLTSYTLNFPAKYQSSYVTVKYALLGLMKALSVEYSRKGITVNGISPDMMETKFLSGIPEMIVGQNRENSPLGRNIYIKEVIPVISYMLSDAGAAMTGQNVGITGGL